MKKNKFQDNSALKEKEAFPGCTAVFFSKDSDRGLLPQSDFLQLIEDVPGDFVALVDGDCMGEGEVDALFRQYVRLCPKLDRIAYTASGNRKLWLGMARNLWSADPELLRSPLLIGRKSDFQKVYGGADLGGDVLTSVAYSVQKVGGVRFCRLEASGERDSCGRAGKWELWRNYMWKIPGRYLVSGAFFRHLFRKGDGVQRDMLFRMLLILFACFTFAFMSYISKDYGVTGDEFVDHRHGGYVLDYFGKGDKAALNQPKTVLHLYGNSVQVITAALCRWFDVDHCYELRHVFGGLVGATGVLAAGLLGLRWGGGLCGLLSILLMFFTPRFFGHSMNNLKDIPFAVGYVLSLFYTIRLFDYFPAVRLRHIIGLVLGIGLTLGTRSGGLVLYPMLLMYAGLFYIQRCGGIREFYKFKKHRKMVGEIFRLLLWVVVISYLLGIVLWPFALVNPIGNVFYSLAKFTNYSIGLRTIFDGEQMMSNMLPWNYAPKYLCIGMPVVTLIGFFAYFVYMAVRKKEFSLIGFFLIFAAVFPVFWVIYKHSNLYGGIRHLLFVMPPMVVLAGRFWSEIVHWSRGYWKSAVVLVFAGLLSLPVIHSFKNHPNEYVYFNEFAGGLEEAYGNYETDYYFNSLKESSDWFRENILPGLPTDRKTIIVTQAVAPMEYYFRKDTNIRVIYSRYYEKYSKDWDYAIFGNVYVSESQLKNGLFPIKGTLYAPLVDGYPMSFVAKRDTKLDLEGFHLEKEKAYGKALEKFEAYIATHPENEEVLSRMGKLYYMTGKKQEAESALVRALELHPNLNEALYISTLLYIDLKDYPKALQAAGGILATNKFSPDGWYLRALVYYRMKNYRESITALNRLLAFRPNFDRAHILAGDIFRDNGDFQKALQMYERASKYNKFAGTFAKRADMLVRLKEYGKAEAILKQLSDGQADYYPIYKVRCRMALQESQWKEAAEHLAQMDGVDNDAEVFVLRAMYYMGVKEYEAAGSMLKRALELDGGDVEALKLQKEIVIQNCK